jgi:SAM-dependent methyltransferase
MKKWLYEIMYRFVPVDWIFGSTSEIERLVDIGIEGYAVSGRTITLGCGVGRETIYLAKKGFDVIGLDFSSTAINQARRRAKAEGLEVPFIVDDLTNLRHVHGTFDLVTDFGALNDMNEGARDLYMNNILQITHPPFDEVKRRFHEYFRIEELERRSGSRFPASFAYFLMTRMKEVPL